MQRRFERGDIPIALQSSLIVLVAVLLGTASLWAHPAKGAPAPPLDSLKLLQAPAGARADWASLKGKVVVLEFWATWCSPCVASLPHLNQLVESLDPAKFQFISVDDEDQKTIETFLARKKTPGWVGVDTSSRIFAAYRVNSRPTTVIVDGNGKVVAVTEIDLVSAADLQSVAEGKKVAFKPAMEIVDVSPSATPAGSRKMPSVSVTKASPDAKLSQVNHPPTGTDFLGCDADNLFNAAFDIFRNRYVLRAQLPSGLYNLRENFADAPDAERSALLQQEVLAALGLRVQTKTITKSAYILRAIDTSKTLLSPSASTHAVKRGTWHGHFILMNGTMDDLAYLLATGLENPVINETGIDGAYDVRFADTGNDLDSLNAVLKRTLGLELVPGTREMSVVVFEVTPRE